MGDVVDSDLWKLFYNSEKKLFNYIKSNAEGLLIEIGAECEDYNSLFGVSPNMKSPKYIRAIYRLKNNGSEFLSICDEMKEAYKKAVGKKFKNFPSKFPQYFESVEQINISKNKAYESIKIKRGGKLKIFSLNAPEPNSAIIEEVFLPKVKRLAEYFNKLGIKAVYDTTFSGAYVAISMGDLLNYARAKSMQARRESGSQYRALIRHKGESKGCRANYGFIVLDASSECKVFESIPEAPRPHSLEKTGVIFSLDEAPEELDYVFFIKN